VEGNHSEVLAGTPMAAGRLVSRVPRGLDDSPVTPGA
jgi:hypothetical protein